MSIRIFATMFALIAWLPLAQGQCPPSLDDKLNVPEGDPEDHFGYSLAISGDVAVVGTPDARPRGRGSGAAYIFRYDGTGWTREAELTDTNVSTLDGFGYSVGIDGDLVVVGTPFDNVHRPDVGAIYVYRFDGSGWPLEARLSDSTSQTNSILGISVATSAGRILGGQPGAGSLGRGRTGTAVLYEQGPSGWRVLTHLNAGTDDAHQGAEFGRAVSVFNDTLLIGAPSNNDHGERSGSAYVIRFNGSIWSEEAELHPADPDVGDEFGASVAVWGATAMVGSPFDDDRGEETGAVYVYESSPLGGGDWSQVSKLTPADGATGDRFGWSVAISNDVALIGSPYDDDRGTDSGSVYVYRKIGGSWVQTDKIVAIDGAKEDRFGRSVALTKRRFLIGSPHDLDEERGSTYVYDSNLATWSNYGDGWPGTLGVPLLRSNRDPALGSSIRLRIGNSLGSRTTGVLIVGLQRASVDTNLGGELVVTPMSMQAITIPTNGVDIPGAIPNDTGLCGVAVYAQTLEFDTGASLGVSFTPGIELVVGAP